MYTMYRTKDANRSLLAVHEVLELLQGHLVVAILVSILHAVLGDLGGGFVVETHALQYVDDFLLDDGARSILVEVVESGLQLLIGVRHDDDWVKSVKPRKVGKRCC